MMKISREQLSSVGGLELWDALGSMDETAFEKFCASLSAFVEGFPAIEAALMNAFNAKDRESLSKLMLELMDMLEGIHASSYAQSSVKLLSIMRAGDYDSTAAKLTQFLATVSALSIDIQIAALKEVHAPPENAEAADAAAQKSILAVDDMSILLATLKGALQDENYKFTGVTSGRAALKFLDNHQPDLFILDIEMPEMSGYDLAKRIKEQGFTAPIIFLTGNATADYVMRAISVGGSDFIVKPVNKEQVLEKIKKYIG